MGTKKHLKGDEKIGERIKEYRLIRHLSQKQLADMVMVSSSSITRLEKGQSMVSVFTIIEIAKVLQVSVSDILTDNRTVEEVELIGIIEKLKKCPVGQQKALIKGIEQVIDAIFFE